MTRTAHIQAAVMQALTVHERALDDARDGLHSLRVLVRMSKDGRTVQATRVTLEYVSAMGTTRVGEHHKE